MPSPSLPPLPARPPRARLAMMLVWSIVALPPVPTKTPPPKPLPPLAPEPPAPPSSDVDGQRAVAEGQRRGICETQNAADGHRDAAAISITAAGPGAAGTPFGQVAYEGAIGDGRGRGERDRETAAVAEAPSDAVSSGTAHGLVAKRAVAHRDCRAKGRVNAAALAEAASAGSAETALGHVAGQRAACNSESPAFHRDTTAISDSAE